METREREGVEREGVRNGHSRLSCAIDVEMEARCLWLLN